jgi:ribose 5-phosphate isomerase B
VVDERVVDSAPYVRVGQGPGADTRVISSDPWGSRRESFLCIAIGADNAGAGLKNLIKSRLEGRAGPAITDFGGPDAETSTAYPHIGRDVAQTVATGTAERGLLICGTGIGMAITANKVSGIRATVAHDLFSVERSVRSNTCQVLTLGAWVIGPELALRLGDE